MLHDTPEPALANAEAIADRTPLLLPVPRAGEPLSGVGVIAAVAEGFRTAELHGAPAGDDAERWGALVLREPLGSGTFGEVYRAYDPALQRDVALKLRRAEAGVLRWLDEGRALARVRHPNVVVVHGADLHDGRAGLWMERIEGRTLEDELQARGPLPIAEVLHIGLELSSAVHAVHACGLAHGDIKSANVMLEPRLQGLPRCVLMDFGTVRESDGGDDRLDFLNAGTPLVLAPEVLAGEPHSVRGDVYSLGVLLFRLLTARYPVQATTLEELRLAHSTGQCPALGAFRRDLPRGLARAVEAAMCPEASRRTATALELNRALLAVAEPARVLRRRLMLAALVVMTGALLMSGAFWILRPGADMNTRRIALPRLSDPKWAEEQWVFEGANPGSQLGWVSTELGDLNGDRRTDFAVTEAGFDGAHTGIGRVLVFFGDPTQQKAQPGWQATGGQAESGFGAQIARAGDVNGDGHPDLLVSERYARTPDGRIGAVHVYAGDGSTLGRKPAWTLRDDQRLMLGLGDGLAGGFDVNADGYDDVVIGETLRSISQTHEGKLQLFLGGAQGLGSTPAWSIAGDAANAQLGWRCASAGDVDRDGFADLLASAPHQSSKHRDAGQVRLYRGDSNGLSVVPAWSWDGTSDQARLGMTIAGGSDVNGDGYSDVAIGEPGHSSGGLVLRGRILLFLGGPQGLGSKPAWQWRGPCTNSRLGGHSVMVSDLDGDGLAEIAAGAIGFTPPKEQEDRGLVVVFRGRRTGPAREPDWYAMGPDRAAGFGGSVASVGDAHVDGGRLLLVGSPYAGADRRASGRITAFRVRSSAMQRASAQP